MILPGERVGDQGLRLYLAKVPGRASDPTSPSQTPGISVSDYVVKFGIFKLWLGIANHSCPSAVSSESAFLPVFVCQCLCPRPCLRLCSWPFLIHWECLNIKRMRSAHLGKTNSLDLPQVMLSVASIILPTAKLCTHDLAKSTVTPWLRRNPMALQESHWPWVELGDPAGPLEAHGPLGFPMTHEMSTRIPNVRRIHAPNKAMCAYAFHAVSKVRTKCLWLGRPCGQRLSTSAMMDACFSKPSSRSWHTPLPPTNPSQLVPPLAAAQPNTLSSSTTHLSHSLPGHVMTWWRWRWRQWCWCTWWWWWWWWRR